MEKASGSGGLKEIDYRQAKVTLTLCPDCVRMEDIDAG
jgi:hypothetical protein